MCFSSQRSFADMTNSSTAESIWPLRLVTRGCIAGHLSSNDKRIRRTPFDLLKLPWRKLREEVHHIFLSEHSQGPDSHVRYLAHRGRRPVRPRSGPFGSVRRLFLRVRPGEAGDQPSIIGILIPLALAVLIASSYPASTCLATPMPGSFVRAVAILASASGVPSASTARPAWIE